METQEPRCRYFETRYDELLHEAILFDEECPEAWEHFVRITMTLISRGFKRYSVYSVFEVMRWEVDLPNSKGKTSFKLNNNHRPFYARWFMEEYPKHEGFFERRKQKSRDELPTGRPPLEPRDIERFISE